MVPNKKRQLGISQIITTLILTLLLLVIPLTIKLVEKRQEVRKLAYSYCSTNEDCTVAEQCIAGICRSDCHEECGECQGSCGSETKTCHNTCGTDSWTQSCQTADCNPSPTPNPTPNACDECFRTATDPYQDCRSVCPQLNPSPTPFPSSSPFPSPTSALITCKCPNGSSCPDNKYTNCSGVVSPITGPQFIPPSGITITNPGNWLLNGGLPFATQPVSQEEYGKQLQYYQAMQNWCNDNSVDCQQMIDRRNRDLAILGITPIALATSPIWGPEVIGGLSYAYVYGGNLLSSLPTWVQTGGAFLGGIGLIQACQDPGSFDCASAMAGLQAAQLAQGATISRYNQLSQISHNNSVAQIDDYITLYRGTSIEALKREELAGGLRSGKFTLDDLLTKKPSELATTSNPKNVDFITWLNKLEQEGLPWDQIRAQAQVWSDVGISPWISTARRFNPPALGYNDAVSISGNQGIVIEAVVPKSLTIDIYQLAYPNKEIVGDEIGVLGGLPKVYWKNVYIDTPNQGFIPFTGWNK
ncbi:MAG: hypothetical protein V1858_04360 [Candidatus Gottesmanbacteria bacterium]